MPRIVLVLVGLLPVLLVGCSDDDGGGGGEDATTTTEAESDSTEVAAGGGENEEFCAALEPVSQIDASASPTQADVDLIAEAELVAPDEIRPELQAVGEYAQVLAFLHRLTVAPRLGEAVRRIADESSVSSLFD